MKLKTILILFICLICQLSCLAYNENITDDSDYKNIMNDVRQRNLNEQILQTENQTQTTEEQIILPVKNSEIPVIATIRDKETDVIPEQTDIFIPDNNQYLDDFEEDNTVVPLSSPTSTTVIPQHYNSKESDNNWGLLLIFTIVVLYCILGWKLDYSYSSSSDNTEDTDKPQDKSAPRNLYNHNIKEYINPINNNENSYWHNIQNKVYEKYGRECFMCGSRMNIDVHHKIPRSEGGTNIIENLIPLCRDCHQKCININLKMMKIM